MKHPQEFGNSQRKLINFLERIVGFGISISCLCLLVVNPQFQSIDPIYVQEAQWVEVNHVGEFIFLHEFIYRQLPLKKSMPLFLQMIFSWDTLCANHANKSNQTKGMKYLISFHRNNLFQRVMSVRTEKVEVFLFKMFKAFSTCRMKKILYPTPDTQC